MPIRAAWFTLALLLTGCANLTSVYHEPTFDEAGVIMDAKQRAIVVKRWSGDPTRKSFACAEPSPDALASFAASIAAEVKRPEVAEGVLKTAFGDTAASLGGRTATIQLFRDALFRVCEALMNNAIEEEEYLLLAQKYQDAMVTLLAIEQLTTMHRNASGATVSARSETGAGSPRTATEGASHTVSPGSARADPSGGDNSPASRSLVATSASPESSTAGAL